MKNVVFKTLMLKGEAGGTITSIEKRAASGGVMIMRMYLSDGTHVDFEVNDEPDQDLIDNRIEVKTADMRTAVEGLTTVYRVTLGRNNWVETGAGDRFVNTVTIQGVKSTDNLEIVGFTPTESSVSNEALKTELGYITYGVTGHNEVAFVAQTTKPTLNIPIVLRKVVEGV
jgi:hypothetical protein